MTAPFRSILVLQEITSDMVDLHYMSVLVNRECAGSVRCILAMFDLTIKEFHVNSDEDLLQVVRKIVVCGTSEAKIRDLSAQLQDQFPNKQIIPVLTVHSEGTSIEIKKLT